MYLLLDISLISLKTVMNKSLSKMFEITDFVESPLSSIESVAFSSVAPRI